MRTRAALIQAAAHVIGEKGYHRVSLDEVARRAGMTRGAIYGNFKDKEDLILQVVLSQWKAVPPSFKPGATFKEQMRILGEGVATITRQMRAHAVGVVSFQLYVITNEAMRKRLVQLNTDIYRHMERELVKIIPEKDLPMSPELFVRVTHALRDGLMVLSFMMPELITDDVIVAAFEALA